MTRKPPSTLWEWAVVIGYLTAPWGALWLFGEHKTFKKAVGAGVLFALMANYLDHLGISLFLWWYPEQPVPLVTGNALWNILSAAPTAILVSEIALSRPRQLWFWIGGISLMNAAAELLALMTTDLMAYPHWSPSFSLPVYVLLYWLTVRYTRWVWAPPAPWRQPQDQ